jgi:phosphoserine aminotransferase
VFAIYLLGLVVKHWLAQGGLTTIAASNRAKAQLLYDTIDASEGFYRGRAHPGSRSVLNVTFDLPTPELEVRFLADSTAAGLIGLQGHRSIGGLRASLYNAVPITAVQALVAFMHAFQRRYSS